MLANDAKTGSRYALGEKFKNEDLARTFELIAEKGIDEFYTGELAKEIVSTVRVRCNGLYCRAAPLGVSALRSATSVHEISSLPVESLHSPSPSSAPFHTPSWRPFPSSSRPFFGSPLMTPA